MVSILTRDKFYETACQQMNGIFGLFLNTKKNLCLQAKVFLIKNFDLFIFLPIIFFL